MSWVHEWFGQHLHVVPLHDVRDHHVSKPDNCWCEPEVDGTVSVHNSMDRREEYERGERQPS